MRTFALVSLLVLAAPLALAQVEGPFLPDLAIFSFLVEPRDDGTAFVSLTVRNEGDSSAPAFDVIFYLDFEPERTVTMDALDHGFVKTTTFTLTGLAPGEHLLHAQIDPEGKIAQHHRVEHDKPMPFTVPERSSTSPTPATPTPPPAKPDLVVRLFRTTPAPAKAGDMVSFELTVANGGQATAKGVSARLWDPDHGDRLFALPATELAPGAETRASITTAYPRAGSYAYEITLDPGNAIAESDEGNNVAKGTILIAGPAPDIVVERVVIDPASPTIGDMVTVRATLRNVGTAATEAIQANVTATTGGTRPLVGAFKLAAGATGEVSYTYPWLAPGNQTFRVSAFPLGASDDPTPANNLATLTATVAGSGTYLPDWVVTTIEESNDNATLRVIVRNAGNGASEPVDVSLAMDGAPIAGRMSSTKTEYTEPGLNRTVLFERPANYGDGHTLRASIDATNAVRESDEANNVLEIKTDSVSRVPGPSFGAVALAALAAALVVARRR